MNEVIEYSILLHAFEAMDSGKRKVFNDWCMKHVANCSKEILKELWDKKLLMVNGWKDTRLSKIGTDRFFELRDKGIQHKWNWGSPIVDIKSVDISGKQH
jgi:hypothetical protein